MDALYLQLTDFLASAFGIAGALFIIGILVRGARRMGWRAPLDLPAIFDGPIELSPITLQPEMTVDVEFHDNTNLTMDLGPLIEATLGTSRGQSFQLHKGVFVGCRQDWVKAGVSVDIAIQGGIVRERLAVQVDMRRQILFVKSRHTLAEVVARINHTSPPVGAG